MPAGTALAPGGLPEGLSFLFGLPEHEIVGILFALFTSDLDLTEAGLEIVQVFMGQLSVILEFSHPVINGAVCRRVSIALFDQGADHIQHAADLLCGQGILCGGHDIHCLHILSAFGNIPLGDRICVHALLDGLFNDLVVHVSKVGYKIHLIALILKISADRIEYDHGTGVSDMDQVIDRGAADIHFYFSRLHRNELFFSSGKGIIDFHGLLLFFILSDSRHSPYSLPHPSGPPDRNLPPWRAGTRPGPRSPRRFP